MARPNKTAEAWLLLGMEVVVELSAAGFDDAVRAHIPAMWVLATRLAGPSRREDVVQEALLTAWRRWSTYDAERGSLRTWLLLLVTDRCRKAWRSERAHLELVDEPARGDDTDARVDLTRAVSALPKRQRLAVELHYVLGLPVAETAAVMGCAVGTVTSTLSDARRALRAKLEVSA